MTSRYHVDSSNDTSYIGRFDYDGSPNVVSPTMSVCLIVDFPTAILPNVCLPNQPLTKRAFIANLQPKHVPLPNPAGHASPFLTLRGMLPPS